MLQPREVVRAARYGRVEEIRASIAAARRGEVDLNSGATEFSVGSFGTTFFTTGDDTNVPSRVIGYATPLAIAAAYGHLNIVRLLVESNLVDVNRRTGYGNDFTAFDCARRWGENNHIQIQEYLRNNGGRSNLDSADDATIATVCFVEGISTITEKAEQAPLFVLQIGFTLAKYIFGSPPESPVPEPPANNNTPNLR